VTKPEDQPVSTTQRRRANLRLALVLASVAGAFAAGFVAKIVMTGG
jgi:hypothetical protein